MGVRDTIRANNWDGCEGSVASVAEGNEVAKGAVKVVACAEVKGHIIGAGERRIKAKGGILRQAKIGLVSKETVVSKQAKRVLR